MTGVRTREFLCVAVEEGVVAAGAFRASVRSMTGVQMREGVFVLGPGVEKAERAGVRSITSEAATPRRGSEGVAKKLPLEA